MSSFDIRSLAPVVVLTGHYGVGKTNLAINLALDARRSGREVAVADLDVVNPYFRTSDYRNVLAEAGVHVISTAFAGTTLDNPGVTGRVATACEWAYEAAGGEGRGTEAAGCAVAADAASCEGMEASEVACSNGACAADGVAGEAACAAEPSDASAFPKRLFIIDAGGDDAGATALGRFAAAIEAGPYDMLHVVNRSRNLTHRPEQAIDVLQDVERASRLRVTALVNNTHMSRQTDRDILSRGVVFARDVAQMAGLLLAFTTVPRFLERDAGELGVVYPVDVYVKKPWE
jgi:hypothetical protein